MSPSPEGPATPAPTFTDVLFLAASQPEFVRQVDRLRGTNLSTRGRSPLNDLIDDHTGRTDADLMTFVETVYDLIWTRCPALHAGPP